MKEEIWKEVVGYEGLYEISSEGRVKRLARWNTDSLGRRRFYSEKILINYISKQTGYPCVNLSKEGLIKTINIHRMIAEAFIPNPDNLPCVNHIDQNRANSVLSNLEWCDYSYNNSYGDACKKRKKTLRKNLEGKHKTIYQFSLDGNLIQTYYCGIHQVEEKLGYDIGDNLLRKSKTAHGFVFSYSPKFHYEEDLPLSHQKYVILIDDNGKEIKRYKSVSQAGRDNGFDRHYFSRATPVNGIITIRGLHFIIEKKENEYIPVGHKGPRPDLIGKNAKKVYQYSKDGEFIKRYDSVREAGEAMGGKSRTSDITNCCNGKLKSAFGYMWSYDGSQPLTPFKDESIRKIKQYTIDGEYVASFDSIKDAAIKVGNGKPGSISNNLKGWTKSAFGYKWKYANE